MKMMKYILASEAIKVKIIKSLKNDNLILHMKIL